MGWISKEVEGELENPGHIHFCDGLRQICGDLSETFPSAVSLDFFSGTRGETPGSHLTHGATSGL